MGRGPSGSRPVLDVFVEQWPLLIFVPAVLILIAVLAGVTRWWDRRDAERSADTTARRADAATGPEVAARSPHARRGRPGAEAAASGGGGKLAAPVPGTPSDQRWASRPTGEPRQMPPRPERHVLA
jgi:hypothetical protein